MPELRTTARLVAMLGGLAAVSACGRIAFDGTQGRGDDGGLVGDDGPSTGVIPSAAFAGATTLADEQAGTVAVQVVLS